MKIYALLRKRFAQVGTDKAMVVTHNEYQTICRSVDDHISSLKFRIIHEPENKNILGVQLQQARDLMRDLELGGYESIQ